MKKLVPILALIIIGFALYKNLPGFKAKANELVDKYGGWTEEARKQDPKGFIEHAEETLKANKEKFTSLRTQIAAKRTEVEASKATALETVAFADKATGDLKLAFQQASTGTAYPVTFPDERVLAGKSYTEEQLKDQVSILLQQKAAHEGNVGIYDQVLTSLKEKDSELGGRITNISSELASLGAKKISLEASALTAEADEMMGQINEMIADNGKLAEELSDNPVQDLEELMKNAAKNAEEAQAPKAVAASNAVNEFLSN